MKKKIVKLLFLVSLLSTFNLSVSCAEKRPAINVVYYDSWMYPMADFTVHSYFKKTSKDGTSTLNLIVFDSQKNFELKEVAVLANGDLLEVKSCLEGLLYYHNEEAVLFVNTDSEIFERGAFDVPSSPLLTIYQRKVRLRNLSL